MGQVLANLCTQTGLEWSSAPSGNEVFVTLSRQGVVVAMTPSVTPVSSAFKRPPGTIAFVHRALYNSLVSIDADVHHCCALDVVVTVEARGKLFVVCHLLSGGSDETNGVSVYV